MNCPNCDTAMTPERGIVGSWTCKLGPWELLLWRWGLEPICHECAAISDFDRGMERAYEDGERRGYDEARREIDSEARS